MNNSREIIWLLYYKNSSKFTGTLEYNIQPPSNKHKINVASIR